MMDFSVSPKVQELSARVRDFVKTCVQPLEARLSEPWTALEPALRQVRSKAKAAGLFAIQRELPLSEFAVISEELGRTPLGHFAVNCQAPDVGNMELLELAGSDAQKKRFLEPLAAGEIRSCFSMTEPDRAGSNPTWLDTRAVLKNGEWVIDGHKWFTTAADGARFAVVMAVTEPDAPPHLRASMLVVPADTPGFRIVRNIPVMGHPGSGWMSHSEIRYEGCRVPEENLLGGRGAGFALAQERLGPGRIHHCMRWIGICERSFELMCARAARREVAPGTPLGQRQIVQEWIADSRAEIDAARLSVLRAAWRMEKDGQRAARVEISTIKYFVAGVLQRVLDRALQTHGALGMTDETPLAFWYREERAARIYDGPDEVHKGLVARQALKAFGVDVK
jgi:acyl-CoA dehydrogenase